MNPPPSHLTMHRLLIRQMQHHPSSNLFLDSECLHFLEAISRYYHEIDQERMLLENALEVNSHELTAANEALLAQAEEEHALLRGVIDSIPDPIFFKTRDNVYLGCNRAFEKYLGLAEGDIVGKSDADLEKAHANTFLEEKELQMLTLNLANVSEEWVTYPEAKKVCLEVRRTPYSSTEGKLLGMIGIGRDITKRKKLENDMRIASLVFQHSGEGMLVTDAANLIIAVNPAAAKITGYSFKEVVRKNPRIFKSDRQDVTFYTDMWQKLTTIGHWHGEIWDRHKSGALYAKWMTINTLKNDDGTLHGYIALFSDITEKKMSEELIWKQANFDMLTGLPNRQMLRDRLEQQIKNEHRAGLSLALLFIDLDHFKEVNDTLGHHVGDDLLIEAGRRIKACIRESDTVGRLGGDEFTITLSQLTDISHVEVIAQAIVDKLAEPLTLGDETVYISASIGITIYPTDATEVDQLLKNADQAMYVAKSQGRNRFSYFTPSLQKAAQNRLHLISALHAALAGQQFRIFFQPIINLATGHIHKAEALVRWQHPESGMVSPAEFIPLAEETGLIVEIGDWVFREAVLWTKRWAELCPDGLQVSVNMSPVQFRKEGNRYVEAWLDYLKEVGLPGESVVIEITEGLLLKANLQVAKKLHEFRKVGIRVALDDFGTGYSSLAYIKKFAIDFLKIDQSFVRNLATDKNDRVLSEAIIVMSHKLGIQVIAEGVETEEQKALLVAAGCDYAQGYLFSKPVPPEQFGQLLEKDMADSTRW